MGNEDELVEEFCGVTTSTPEHAKFFLESTEWLLEPALQLYFESDHLEQGRETSINFADYDLAEDENWSIPEPEMLAPDNLLQGSILSNTWNPVNPALTTAVVRSPRQPIESFRKGQTRPRGEEEGNDKRGVTSRDADTAREGLGKSSDTVTGSDDQEYTGGERSCMVVQDPNKKHDHGDMEVIYERLR